MVPSASLRRSLPRALVPSPVSCAQPPVPALRPVPKALKPFGPPALVQQAPRAIILAALRRFRGPALFRGLRPSSSPGAPCWPSGLTLRSSGPAFCGPLTLAVKALCVLDRSPNPGVAIGSAIAGPSGCLWLAFRLRSCLPSPRKSCSEPPASSFSSAQWCCGVRHGVTRPFASRAGHVPVAVSLGCQIRRLGLVLLACVQTAGSVSMKRLNRLVKRTGLRPSAYLARWASL